MLLKEKCRMRRIEYYEKLRYRLEITPDLNEGGYVASYPELPGCMTIGETVQKAVENAEEAKREWLSAAIEDGITIPEPGELNDYSGQFVMRVPKSLHKTLAERAKAEGTSMNQYCLYLLSKY